jgi:hypothetical protein
MHKKIARTYDKFKSWMAYNPPGSMTSKGWRLFGEEYKKVAPIRYWFAHDFLHIFVYPIKWKYRRVSEWIRYRTYDKYHIVNTGLQPSYYDVDTQMLHVNFNLLKEFVEVEQASCSYWMSDNSKNASWCEKNMPFYRAFYPFRRPDLGIKHFEWAATLDDPNLPPHEQSVSQAIAAREILVLYKWWTEDRPNRKEYDVPEYKNQGLGMLGCFDDDFDKDAPDYVAHNEAMTKNSTLEEDWSAEDDDMLVRLMKIRKSLWS